MYVQSVKVGLIERPILKELIFSQIADNMSYLKWLQKLEDLSRRLKKIYSLTASENDCHWLRYLN